MSTTPPIHAVVTLEATGSGTRMTTVTTFADAAHREQMITMGMAEGLRQATGQIDAVLAGG